MPKIIKNGKEYSGVPIEVVTAWAPTADPVQVKEPLMGNTDISDIGDGTVTGAIDDLNTGLTDLLVTEWFNQNGRAIQAGSVDDYDFDCAKTGYTLLGVIGTTITSGGGCTTVYLDKPSATTIKYRIRNNGTSAVTPQKVWVLCLYVKS